MASESLFWETEGLLQNLQRSDRTKFGAVAFLREYPCIVVREVQPNA